MGGQQSLAVSNLTYAAPAWWGYADANSRQRLQAIVNKFKKLGFLSPTFSTHEQLCEQMCANLFRAVCYNPDHVLHHLLQPERESHYDMRNRAHNRIIPKANKNFRKNFIIKMLYTNCY